MFAKLGNFENNLFDEVRKIQQEMDQLFGTTTWPSNLRAVARGTYPDVNIGSTPEQVDVLVFIPGIDPATLDISIQQNLLTVAGERTIQYDNNANYYRQERFSGNFRRVLSLPEDVDPNQVQAAYQEGVLHIVVKRSEASKPRQIEVKTA